MRRNFMLLALVVAATSCESNGGMLDPTGVGFVRVINASRVPFTVYLDNTVRQASLTMADVTTMSVSSGNHQVRILTSTGAEVQFSTRTFGGELATTAMIGGNGTPLLANAIADTGSIVPAGKSKMRVTHLAGGGQAVEIWRTQPDFPTPVHIMTPFNYLATSPYLQSDAGNWEVFVTLPGSTSKLATTGSFLIPAGERRTVALLDSAGILKLRVMQE